MKIISSTFLVALLPYSYSLHAMHDNEKVRSKNILIKQNLKLQENRLPCITPLKEYNVVDTEFQRLIEYFHYDRDLKYYYVSFLLDSSASMEKSKQFAKGLKQFAELIQLGSPTSYQTWLFMDYLSKIDVDKQHVKEFLDYIMPPIQDWEGYAENQKIKSIKFHSRNNNPNKIKTVRDEIIFKNSKLFFNSLHFTSLHFT